MAGRIILKGEKGNPEKIIKYKERINGKDKVVSLGIKINEKFFNDTNEWYKWVKDKHPQAQQLNEQIADFLKSKGYLTPNHKDYGLVYLIENKIIINKLNYNTHRNYLLGIKKFKKYLNEAFNKDDIKLNQVDRSLMVGYLHYLKKEYPTGNTARQKLSIIKSAITDLSVNHNIAFDNNLLSKLVIKKVKSNKDFLSFREVNILKYSFLGKKRNYDLSLSRYAFIFSVIANGIRVSDCLLMKYSNIVFNKENYYLRFKHKKTGNIDTILLNDDLLFIVVLSIVNKGLINDDDNINSFKSLLKKMETLQQDFYNEAIKYNESELEINTDSFTIRSKEQLMADIAIKIDDIKNILIQYSKQILYNFLHSKSNNLNYYIFEYMNNYTGSIDVSLKYARNTYNTHLKEIGQRLIINLKNSHQARHTTTNLNILSGTNTYYLSNKILKHSDLAQSQNYINEIKEQYNNDTTTFDIINNNKQF